VRILAIFQHGGLCSATSINSSRRDLLNDMAEHMPILKNNLNTLHPRFGYTPKTGIASAIFCLNCVTLKVMV